MPLDNARAAIEEVIAARIRTAIRCHVLPCRVTARGAAGPGRSANSLFGRLNSLFRRKKFPAP
jgi:hypothetical protein